MASQYFFKSVNAVDPKPEDMVDTPPTAWEGSYVAAKTMLLAANTGSAASLAKSHLMGTDPDLHSLKGTGFVTPALATQTIASQTWTLTLWAGLNILPVAIIPYIYARLFVWNGQTDAFRAFIGSTMSVQITQAAQKAYTLTTVGSASPLDSDVIVCEVYFVVDDDPADPDAGSFLTLTHQFNSAARNSNVNSPATIAELAGVPLYGQAWTP